MANSEVSDELKNIQKILITENFNPKNAIEFFCEKDKLEPYKDKLRKKCKGKCFFFTREKEDKIHVIALINLVINKASEANTLQVINKIKENAFQESSFNPTSVAFGSKRNPPAR